MNLDSIEIPSIIEDTRNQKGKHKNINKYMADNGITVHRSKLTVGDYTLPTLQTVAIDTKKGMSEVYQNIIHDHQRLKNECMLAQELGTHLVILIEDSEIHGLNEVAGWHNPLETMSKFSNAGQANGWFKKENAPKRGPVPSPTVMKAMKTMSERYAVEWQFCNPEETGARIIQILREAVLENLKAGARDFGKLAALSLAQEMYPGIRSEAKEQTDTPTL
jgi:ribosome-associated protein